MSRPDSRRRLVRAACALLPALTPAACEAQAREARDVPGAEALLRSGRYEEAIASFRALADSPGTPGARRGLLRALAIVGRYDEAERTGRGYVQAGSAEARVPLAEVLMTRGRLASADSVLAPATSGSPDSLRARVLRAEILWRRGERDAALRAFDRFIDAYNAGSGRLTAEELGSVAVAMRHLGERDPQAFKDALRAWDAAIAKDSTNPDAHVQLAELFLAKYAAGDAEETVKRALALAPNHPGALLVAARRAHFDGDGQATALARRALESNPNLVDARVFLAASHLDAEDDSASVAEAMRALAVDSSSGGALAVIAAARLLRGDERGYAEVERRARAAGADAAALYATVAEAAARHRRYERAVALARQAVAADSLHWKAHAVLGLNLMRTGKSDEARVALERAFAGDPYDVWVKNTLDLLDTYKDYETVATPRFRFMLDRGEAALLSLYLGELMEEGYDAMARRYGYRPPAPIRLELFRRHADFSVRTVGLAGLGALGVSFGSTLAMDSPAAREAGDFNWGSTAWHELAHAFTLGMTDHRVPRWLSEGISVLEERKARPGWGAGVSIPFLAAYKAGAMVKPSRLNDGFVRPRHPNEVALSYYQASLVCEMIEREWGAAALPAMLRGYRDGLTTEQVFERALGIEPKELDARFDAYMRQRFATPLGALRLARNSAGADGLPALASPGQGTPAPDDFLAQLHRGRTLLEAGQAAEAIPFLERARTLFPELGGDASPRDPLARALEATGNLRAAAAQLDTLSTLGEPPRDALLALARIRDRLGDRAAAADALARAIWISPYDAAQHRTLAGLYEATGNAAGAVREWRAVVALDPVDRAEAYYRLALAHERAGQAAEARRAVLAALEEAPNYEDAQELLLRLRGGTP